MPTADTMDKPEILICGQVTWATAALDELRDRIKVLQLQSNSRTEFLSECRPGGAYGNVVGIYRHNDSSSKIGIFDRELIDGLPDTVRYICHNGAGYDQINVRACAQRGISVSNTPGAVDDSTATTAMYLIIGALRGLSLAEATARSAKFKDGLQAGNDPEGKVLGIVGMGGIGRALARRAIGFSMRIIYHNRRPLPREKLMVGTNPSMDISPFVEYCPTLEELLRRSDVVSLNLPLNSDTLSSFGAQQFRAMKPGSVLINTARGAIVDEDAMLDALDSGLLKSVGLDVYPDEPNINPRLLSNPKIQILPHMGTETEETQGKMEIRALIHNLAKSVLHQQGLEDQIVIPDS